MDYQVIVVGGGHAGCEAAYAAARLGARTLLLTQNLDTIGHLSCNPAIGGLGKGHLVCEIDAMGGLMGLCADHAAIQFRLLNRRKGPAVRGPRGQMDRTAYKTILRQLLDATPNLTLRQGEAIGLQLDGTRLTGVATDWGDTLHTRSVVLTTGTFLSGLVHIGERRFAAGRLGCAASTPLAGALRALDLAMYRMKTGTPARLDGRTINWPQLEIQEGDADPVPFSFLSTAVTQDQVPCHITHTTRRTHEIIRENLHRAPLYSGQIQGIGPRYCPSIEDKVVRFADRDHHQIFLEPEGRHTREIYPNGLSTSLPIDVQWAMLRSIIGLEQVILLRPGYAIEYDMSDPRQLGPDLGLKSHQGFYFAGQINGTTGYEEAAGQGLLAGINAAHHALERPAVIMERSNSYLGVMVDDLVTKGVDEPYRLFTSRAEFRLLLRADNADSRLTPLGHAIGLVDEPRWQRFLAKEAAIHQARSHLEACRLQAIPELFHTPPVLFDYTMRRPAMELLRRHDIALERLLHAAGLDHLPREVQTALEVDAHYAGYLDRQSAEVERFRHSESIRIPPGLDWGLVQGLSTEIRQKLTRVQPVTLGQAYRIPGVTPAAITAILVYLQRIHGVKPQPAWNS